MQRDIILHSDYHRSLAKVRSDVDGVEGGYYGKCIISEQSRATFDKNAASRPSKSLAAESLALDSYQVNIFEGGYARAFPNPITLKRPLLGLVPNLIVSGSIPIGAGTIT